MKVTRRWAKTATAVVVAFALVGVSAFIWPDLSYDPTARKYWYGWLGLVGVAVAVVAYYAFRSRK